MKWPAAKTFIRPLAALILDLKQRGNVGVLGLFWAESLEDNYCQGILIQKHYVGIRILGAFSI